MISDNGRSESKNGALKLQLHRILKLRKSAQGMGLLPLKVRALRVSFPEMPEINCQSSVEQIGDGSLRGLSFHLALPTILFVEALEKTYRPTCTTPLDLRVLLNAGFHRTEFYRDESAWFTLFNSVQDVPLMATLTKAGSLSEAWKANNGCFNPETPGREIELLIGLVNTCIPPESNPT